MKGVCHVNQKYRIHRFDIRKSEDQSKMNTNYSSRFSLLKAIGLFMGASFFAYLLSVAIHESGHYLTSIILEVPQKGIALNPFGSNYNYDYLYDVSTPLRGAFMAAAGPLFDLLITVTVSLLLWRKRSPVLLPLLLLGSYALIQESVSMIMVLIDAYGDWSLVISLGVPSSVVGLLAVVFLVAGCFWMLLLLPLAGINAQSPIWYKMVVLLAGIPMLFLIAVVYQTLFGVDQYIPTLSAWATMENVRKAKIIFMIASTVLTAIITPLHRLLFPWLDRLVHTPVAQVRWGDVLIAIGLGTAIVIIQFVFFNDPTVVVR
jgi:hypothetical protein